MLAYKNCHYTVEIEIFQKCFSAVSGTNNSAFLSLYLYSLLREKEEVEAEILFFKKPSVNPGLDIVCHRCLYTRAANRLLKRSISSVYLENHQSRQHRYKVVLKRRLLMLPCRKFKNSYLATKTSSFLLYQDFDGCCHWIYMLQMVFSVFLYLAFWFFNNDNSLLITKKKTSPSYQPTHPSPGLGGIEANRISQAQAWQKQRSQSSSWLTELDLAPKPRSAEVQLPQWLPNI